MQNISEFQKQFPLSKHKIYKKVTSKIFVIVLFSLVISIFSWLSVSSLSGGEVDTSVRAVVTIYLFSVSAITIFILIIYAIYVGAYIKRYYYDSTNFITIKKGVFAPTEIHVQYQKIQDVYVDQDILDRIFGIYDVHIASATFMSGIEAHIDGVDAHVAEGLKNFILGKIQGSTYMPNASAEPVSAATTKESPVVVNFNEEISSQTFPINNKWYTQQVLHSIIFSMFYSVITTFWFFGSKVISVLVTTRISVWLALSVIFFVVMIIRSIIWKSKFYFAFLPQFIVQKTGVVATQEKHLPYKSVQDVMIRQGLIERILGLCTVVVQNAANGGMSSDMYSKRNTLRLNDANVIIPGQPLAKGKELVDKLNKVLVHKMDSMGL